MHQFKEMVDSVCAQVPINVDNILRVNRRYVAFHANLASMDGSSSFYSAMEELDGLRD